MTANKIRINFVRRTVPKRGPFLTDEYNAAMEELSVDLNNLSTRWNTEAYPILNSLPRGADEDRWSGATNVPDPLSDGLDGDNMFVDNAASTTRDDGLLWLASSNRPMTIREFALDIDGRITGLYEDLAGEILGVASGLSDEQWDRLGLRVKDGGTSAPDSTDGMATTAYTDLGTLILDVFDDEGDLGSLGTSTYTLEQMVGKLCQLHGSDWNADPSGMDHSALTGIPQTGVDQSVSYNKKARGSTTNLEEDLNRLRWEIARTRVGSATTTSTGQWNEDVTDPVDSGVACLSDHINYLGDGTIDPKNPHKLHRQNITGLDTELGYIHTFIGKSGMGNETPTYSSHRAISDGDSLETAIGKIDAISGGGRVEFSFQDHTDEGDPIVVEHNTGITFPIVQIVDTYVADYIYSGELEIPYGDRYATVDYVDENRFDVYTNIIDGKILYIA